MKTRGDLDMESYSFGVSILKTGGNVMIVGSGFKEVCQYLNGLGKSRNYRKLFLSIAAGNTCETENN